MSRTIIHIEKQVIDHPVEHVWSIISSFGAAKAWIPSLKWCEINGHGIGSVRTVMSIAGVAKEKLEILDAAAYTISYRILDPVAVPAEGGYGTLKLEGQGENKTILTWTADAEKVTSEGIAIMQPLYEQFIQQSIGGLKKALE